MEFFEQYYQEEEPIDYAANLAVCNSRDFDDIVSRRAMSEKRPFVESDNVEISSTSSRGVTVRCRVQNFGEADSNHCRVVFVIWGPDGRVGLHKRFGFVGVRAGVDPATPGIETIYEEILFASIEIGVDSSSFGSLNDISHIYCVTYDPIRDPLDKYQIEILRSARKGIQKTDVNPSRTSIGIGCCKPQSGFSVSGNRISVSQSCFVETVLTYADAGADAGFGYKKPSGSQQTWWRSLKNTPKNRLLSEKWAVEAGGSAFLLLSSIATRPSTNRKYCQVSQSHNGHGIYLKFEDGGGGQYDDYHLRLFEF